MPILTPNDLKLKLPEMFKVRQAFDTHQIVDVAGRLQTQLAQKEIIEIIKRSKKVAVVVGSRGIAGISEITSTLISFLKQFDTEICIIPAMGSHGDATAEGQAVILERYGISEQTMGVPVRSSLEVVKIGETQSGIPVLFDKIATESDLIIPINRIKPHTDYSGVIESGLCKILAIGLGNHEGCSRLHKEGFTAFNEIIPEAAGIILEKMAVGFGIAVVENAYGKPCELEVIYKNSILDREKALLESAKEFMPEILLNVPLDILIVKELGKEISGAGMDPNITGRTDRGCLEGFSGPKATRIILLNLSDQTKGNGLGLGLADFTLEKTVKQLDFSSMYTNAIASGCPEGARIPIALKDEHEAVIAALKCIPGCDVEHPRIIRIKNTLELEYLDVSEALLDKVDENDRLELVCPCQ